MFDTSIRDNILFSSEVEADEERYAKVLEVCCLVELVNESDIDSNIEEYGRQNV